MLRVYLRSLAAAQKAYEADGGKKNPENPADPYMTLLGYFNSLRELGGVAGSSRMKSTIRLDRLWSPKARERDRRAVRQSDDRLSKSSS